MYYQSRLFLFRLLLSAKEFSVLFLGHKGVVWSCLFNQGPILCILLQEHLLEVLFQF